MKHVLGISLLIFCFSCTHVEEDVEYTQFTSDDLSYLYYEPDSLSYTGTLVQYSDTVQFLLNGRDSIQATVLTDIFDYKSDPASFTRSISGISLMRFNSEIGLEYVSIIVSRTKKDASGVQLLFELMTSDICCFTKRIGSADTVRMDTALVQGAVYQDVIKFKPDTINRPGYRSIYFAKHFGFIKLETEDGQTLERVF